jgi:hypothetical protein
MKPRSVKTLLGLELGARRLTAVELRRAAGDRLEVRRTAQAPLSLDPLSAAPELAGREIANLLAEAGLKGSRCLVCLPLGRVLTQQVQIPAIEEADVAAFLELEAERAFPFAPEDLVVSTSRFTDPAGGRWATLTAVSAGHLAALEKVLQLAGLRPVSITLGATALVDLTAGTVGAAMAWTDAGAELLVATGGGVAALRILGEPADAVEREGAPDHEALVRECRITLGRLPRATREGLRRMRVFGPSAARQSLIQILEPELEGMGLTLEPAGVDAQARIVPVADQWRPAGLTLATACWMLAGKSVLEFLPPRVGRMRQLVRRLMARGVIWKLASGAALVVLTAILAFTWQFWRLNGLEQRWAAVEPEVTRLETLRQKIREYRPWFDDQVHSLEIARRLTEAFPPQGQVWTRSLEIKDLAKVTCTGYVTNNEEYLRMYDGLRRTAGVKNLQGGPLRGEKPPLQFSLSYQWEPEEHNGD